MSKAHSSCRGNYSSVLTDAGREDVAASTGDTFEHSLKEETENQSPVVFQSSSFYCAIGELIIRWN